MMKVRYQTKTRLWFEWDASTAKEAFEQLSSLQEVFDIHRCGCCESDEIRYVVRENDGYQFYELRCNDCSARLEFGQRREGGDLFPKRRDDAGNYRKNNGWYVYRGEGRGSSTDTEQELQPVGGESTPF